LPVFEKLNGSDNYNNWTFLMELYLAHEDLWECVELTTTAASGQVTVVDVKKDQKVRAKISLLVEPQCVPHVRTAKTPKEAWTI
jgi:sucrose-6-phosphate hydrolase SacC (GH32 family)